MTGHKVHGVALLSERVCKSQDVWLLIDPYSGFIGPESCTLAAAQNVGRAMLWSKGCWCIFGVGHSFILPHNCVRAL